MRLFQLDGRLSSCADLVREGSRLADIGTDHGYLPVYLALAGKIPSALACDVNPLPLKSAEDNIRRYGLEDKIAARLTDGLHGVSTDEADDVVIAGMGGELIVRILSECLWKNDPKKRFILQPMTKYELLTGWLYENGFAIEAQKACSAEKKFYTVIAAVYTGEHCRPDLPSCYLGKLDTADKTARTFLEKTLIRLEKQAIGDPSLLPAAEKIKEVINA